MISHPMGKSWHEGLKAGDHQMVPHSLPDEATLEQLARDLPLRLRSFVDDSHLYMALLQARFSLSVHMLHLSTPLLFSLNETSVPASQGHWHAVDRLLSRPERAVAYFHISCQGMGGPKAPSM